jgi:hypothetical protein
MGAACRSRLLRRARAMLAPMVATLLWVAGAAQAGLAATGSAAPARAAAPWAHA